MNFEEELYNLDVPEEHIPELLKFGKNNPEFLTKAIKAEGNAKKYSVAQTKMEPSDLINNQIAFWLKLSYFPVKGYSVAAC